MPINDIDDYKKYIKKLGKLKNDLELDLNYLPELDFAGLTSGRDNDLPFDTVYSLTNSLRNFYDAPFLRLVYFEWEVKDNKLHLTNIDYE